VPLFFSILKIAVNTRLLLKGKLEGIGWFSHETLQRLVEKHPDWEFHFFFDRKPDKAFIYGDNVQAHIVKPQARHPFLYYLWFQFSVKKRLKQLKPDVFLSPDGFSVLNAPCPTIPVIHDLNFETHPEILPTLTSKYYRYFFPKFAKHACRIATVSQYSKKDIQEKYGISASKIDVVYNGVNPLFSPISDERKTQVKERYCRGKEFAVYVGALNPRKNLSRLLRAFDQYISESSSQLRLLIVGDKMHWTADMEKAYQSLENPNNITFTGRLSNNELSLVLGAAKFLAYPSLFEGFGVPIIEAMSANVPVLTSHTSCMPEISGEAAYLIDPFSEAEIKDAIADLDTNEKLRNELITKGKENAAQFSWDLTTQKLENSILNCIAKNGST
jgi:glycosyltransferase involved in cell wall biosynthesis